MGLRTPILMGVLASRKSPFPMSLIPIEDASLWTLNDLSEEGSYNGVPFGAVVTNEGWLHLNSAGDKTASAYIGPFDFTTAGEIAISYSQDWRIKPRISLLKDINNPGAVDFQLTASSTGNLTDLWSASLDVSTAKGKYYLFLDTVDFFGDMTLYVKSLEITKRS